MIKLFRRLIVFVLIGIIPLYVLDFFYSGIVATCSDRSIESWNELVGKEINADCIVLGSSRAMNHIVPPVLDTVLGLKSFNLGQGGAHIDEINARYRLYRKKNKPASIVLINVDHTSLSPPLDYDMYQYYPWFWNESFREELFPIKSFSFAERVLPLYRYKGTRLLGFRRGPKWLDRGWSHYGGHFNDDGFENRVYSFKIVDGYEKYLDSLLDSLQSDGSQVVIFISPFYKDVLEKMSGLDQMRNYYDSLSRARGVSFLDYSDISMSQNSSFFSNPMHLNVRGDLLLTRVLANDVKRYYVVSGFSSCRED